MLNLSPGEYVLQKAFDARGFVRPDVYHAKCDKWQASAAIDAPRRART